MIECKKCSYQLDDNAKFCINCGSRIEIIEKINNEDSTKITMSENIKKDFPDVENSLNNEEKEPIETDIFQTDKIIDEKQVKAERRKRWLEQQQKIRKELPILDKKEDTIQILKRKIDEWKNEGYVVTKLEEQIYKKELHELNQIFTEFEEDIQILKEIKVKLERLDTTGFEMIVEYIGVNLNDPDSKSTILEQVMMLEKKIKEKRIKTEEYRKKIDKWRNNGYAVDILEKSLGKEIIEIEKEFSEFEKKVQTLNELKNIILDLEAKGFEVQDIKTKLQNVNEIDAITEKILELQKQEMEMGPWYLIGRDLYELGNYDEAIQYFDKALQKDPNNEMIQKIRNICYEKSGRFKGELRIPEGKTEEGIEQLYSIGVDQGSLGNYVEAIKYFEKVIEMNPNHEKAWFNNGWANEDLGNLEDALNCYDKLIEINPNNREAWYNKGYVLQGLNRNEEALSFFDELLIIEPNNADIYINKGTILGKFGRFYEAYECFERATEINPFNADSWNKKAMVLYKLNRFEESLESCNEALEIDPENRSARKGKSMCLKKIST